MMMMTMMTFLLLMMMIMAMMTMTLMMTLMMTMLELTHLRPVADRGERVSEDVVEDDRQGVELAEGGQGGDWSQ